ncbi:argininosuccinate synthase [Candidatus Woesearchaeota archaeon]|nr:argininosuccinate synthase [Candidatus Woesearchaeota archaeon]
MKKEKVILAYSGGLDTSTILKWLIDKGYDVVAYIADVGQPEDFDAAKEKALKIGASKVYIEDLKKEFITDFIFPAIKSNAIYEGKYLLGTSLARPIIAKRQIEIAKKEGTKIVAHGATGKGNDQVRFEMTYYTLMPDVKIISPWKNREFLAQFKGRDDLLKYAEEKGIPVKQTSKAPYSTDENIMHISYEAGILEDPKYSLPEEGYLMTVSPKEAPDKETELMVEFKDGIPVKVEDKTNNIIKKKPLELFKYLNKIGGENGIGRDDLVENRFVGMKSRGIYETPAGTILRKAHKDIEGMTMDREVMLIRDSLTPRFSQIIYFGFWYAPEMELMMTMIDKSQENVTGKVYLKLYKGNVMIVGRESDCSLYDDKIASMHELGGYDQTDAIGFIRLSALRMQANAKRNKLLKQ